MLTRRKTGGARSDLPSSPWQHAAQSCLRQLPRRRRPTNRLPEKHAAPSPLGARSTFTIQPTPTISRGSPQPSTGSLFFFAHFETSHPKHMQTQTHAHPKHMRTHMHTNTHHHDKQLVSTGCWCAWALLFFDIAPLPRDVTRKVGSFGEMWVSPTCPPTNISPATDPLAH